MNDLMTWLSPIIVAGITGAFAYLGVKKSVKASNEQTLHELKANQDLFALETKQQINQIKEDINRLEIKQDKHNAVIERTFKLEQRVEDIDKRIK